jgi:hypothetical protein
MHQSQAAAFTNIIDKLVLALLGFFATHHLSWHPLFLVVIRAFGAGAWTFIQSF